MLYLGNTYVIQINNQNVLTPGIFACERNIVLTNSNLLSRISDNFFIKTLLCKKNIIKFRQSFLSVILLFYSFLPCVYTTQYTFTNFFCTNISCKIRLLHYYTEKCIQFGSSFAIQPKSLFTRYTELFVFYYKSYTRVEFRMTVRY